MEIASTSESFLLEEFERVRSSDSFNKTFSVELGDWYSHEFREQLGKIGTPLSPEEAKAVDDVRKQHVLHLKKNYWFLNAWWVRIHEVAAGSPLAEDLDLLYKGLGLRTLLFRFEFPARFPAAPPRVRLAWPRVSSEAVLCGGAVALDVLTDEGWEPELPLAQLIELIREQLVRGETRVIFDDALQKPTPLPYTVGGGVSISMECMARDAIRERESRLAIAVIPERR